MKPTEERLGKIEQPTTPLHWQSHPGDEQLEATAVTVGGGRYSAYDLASIGYGYRRGERFAARFEPPQGRARLPPDPINLGQYRTMAEAKARCEQHYAR